MVSFIMLTLMHFDQWWSDKIPTQAIQSGHVISKLHAIIFAVPFVASKKLLDILRCCLGQRSGVGHAVLFFIFRMLAIHERSIKYVVLDVSRNVITPYPPQPSHTSNMATCMRVPRNVIITLPYPNPFKQKQHTKKQRKIAFRGVEIFKNYQKKRSRCDARHVIKQK